MENASHQTSVTRATSGQGWYKYSQKSQYRQTGSRPPANPTLKDCPPSRTREVSSLRPPTVHQTASRPPTIVRQRKIFLGHHQRRIHPPSNTSAPEAIILTHRGPAPLISLTDCAPPTGLHANCPALPSCRAGQELQQGRRCRKMKRNQGRSTSNRGATDW